MKPLATCLERIKSPLLKPHKRRQHLPSAAFWKATWPLRGAGGLPWQSSSVQRKESRFSAQTSLKALLHETGLKKPIGLSFSALCHKYIYIYKYNNNNYYYYILYNCYNTHRLPKAFPCISSADPSVSLLIRFHSWVHAQLPLITEASVPTEKDNRILIEASTSLRAYEDQNQLQTILALKGPIRCTSTVPPNAASVQLLKLLKCIICLCSVQI